MIEITHNTCIDDLYLFDAVVIEEHISTTFVECGTRCWYYLVATSFDDDCAVFLMVCNTGSGNCLIHLNYGDLLLQWMLLANIGHQQ